jgi:riboflavin synthase
MFTGLIESVGRVEAVTATATGMHIAITTSFAGDLQAGESVSVNGVCLTATRTDAARMQADIGPETARVTTLGGLQPGQPVNLERSMRADSRFGGHFVQGHVDGIGEVRSVRPDGDARWLTIQFPPGLAPFIVHKGSIAVDGISLTVADLRETEFDVMIIPFTWQHTNLSSLRSGGQVNLEGDMVGKYVARAVGLMRNGAMAPRA